MLKNIHKFITSVNSSKFFAGIVMIMLNIGSKYIDLKFSKTQEEFLKISLARELLIFSVAWMGTRDIYMSIVLTASFVILADYVFNEKSKLCVIPAKLKSLENAIDINKDNVITEDEIIKAKKILESAQKQKQKNVQMTMFSYLDAYK